jgi:hypothetical protein
MWTCRFDSCTIRATSAPLADIATADRISKPEFQARLRHASHQEICIGTKRSARPAICVGKADLASIRHVHLDFDHTMVRLPFKPLSGAIMFPS